MNRITKIICCSVLCIPLIAAIIVGVTNNGNFGSKNNGSVSANDSLKAVKILSKDGTLISEYSDNEVLELYWNVISNGSEITEYHPIGNEITTSFTVNYVGNVSENAYTFIMSSDNNANCVYKDINERYYSIKADDAKSLLVRDEFSSVSRYSNAFNLNFSFNGNNGAQTFIVEPDTYNWTYTRIDGEVKSKVQQDGKSTLPVVKVPHKTDFEILFASDVMPETRNITISKDGTLIYNGIPGSAVASFLDFSVDTVLDVTVDAKWHEGEDSKFFGDVKYRFKLLYDVPSKFTLVDKSLKAGEFTIIKVSGAYDMTETITAQSEIMPHPTTSFVLDGKQYLYLPIKSTTAAGNYKIIIDEFAGKTELNFQVRSKTVATHNNLMITPDVAQLATESNVKEYNELVDKYINTFSQEKYWKNNDKFNAPVASGTVICKFGDTLNIPANIKVSDGIYIKGAQNSAVKAAHDGVVLYAGKTSYAGNAVIIDHGVGVISYYFNLGSTSCKAGERVLKGSNIGTVGTTGYTPFENTIYYANSIGGSFVNPQTQLDYGIDID